MNQKVKPILVLLFYLLSHSSLTGAQEVDESKLKAAFIYNFLKHTRWPDEQSKQYFSIAVYKDEEFYNILEPLLENKLIRNKPIQILNTQNLDELKQADIAIVFLPANNNIANIATSLRRTKTLLITQNSANKKDVMINFMPSSDGPTLSFEINKSNLLYEELTISDALMLLGGSELDVAILYRETELAMQEMKRQERIMQQDNASLQQSLSVASAKLANSEKQLSQNNNALAQKKAELDERESLLQQLQLKVAQQNNLIVETEVALREIAQQRSGAIENYNKTLQQRDEEVAVRKSEIRQLELKTLQNKLDIDAQTAQLTALNSEIIVKNQTIKSKDTYLAITITVVIIGSLFLGLIVLLFIRNRKVTAQLQSTLMNLKKTQAQLVQSDKMASLGLLTAGISHEINTPIGVVITALSVITHKVQELSAKISENKITKSSMNTALQDILHSTELSNSSLTRVTTLISNFKQLAVDQVIEEPRKINVAKYINELMNTLASKLKKSNIQFASIENSAIEITTIPGALAQVLTNFVTNAIHHAFFIVKANSEQPKITYQLMAREDGGVTIIFSDNGCGMSTDILSKIYEPFFTTKRGKGGTGLGMHIVFNIVHQTLFGQLHISSVVDQGTTIELQLPATIPQSGKNI